MVDSAMPTCRLHTLSRLQAQQATELQGLCMLSGPTLHIHANMLRTLIMCWLCLTRPPPAGECTPRSSDRPKTSLRLSGRVEGLQCFWTAGQSC